MTRTWPADRAACYGVACPKHAECARYLAVDGASDRQVYIGTCDPCDDTGPAWPMFIAVDSE